jgi:hypothetical protein
MKSPHCPSRFFGKLFYFALIGFIVILLAAPVLAVLSVVLSMVLAILSFALAALVIVLPFAVLGFLVWAPLQAAFSGRPIEWRQLGRICKGIFNNVLGIPRRAWSMMTWSGRAAHEKVSGLSSHVGVVLFETFCGALVGFMLGITAANMPAQQQYGAMAGPGLGALIGAVLGALVGTSRIRVKDPGMEHSAEGVN